MYNPRIQNAYAIASQAGGRVKQEPIIQDQYMYFPVTLGSLDAPGTLRVKYFYCNVGETSIIS